MQCILTRSEFVGGKEYSVYFKAFLVYLMFRGQGNIFKKPPERIVNFIKKTSHLKLSSSII